MKKVLELICDPFVNGGEETFIINIIKNINRADLKIDLYAPFGFDNDYYKSIINECGGEVFVHNPALKTDGVRIGLISPLNNLLSKNNYDVIHIHSSTVSGLAISAVVARIKGIKTVIVHSHGTGEKNSLRHITAKTVFNPLLFFCPTDYYACSTDAGRWKYPKSIVNRKMTIIHNGIDLNLYRLNNSAKETFRNKCGFSASDMVIGHAGRFSEEKNHEFLIDIFFEIHKKDNRYKLLLLGDGELRKTIELKVNKLGLTYSVFFTGNVPDVYNYLQAMDVFLLPSKFEGLGMAGVEAQASGLPVIYSTGVPEEAKLTESVVFVSLEEKEKWIETIEKMIKLSKSDNTEIVREAGYDINETVKIIEEKYLNG